MSGGRLTSHGTVGRRGAAGGVWGAADDGLVDGASGCGGGTAVAAVVDADAAFARGTGPGVSVAVTGRGAARRSRAASGRSPRGTGASPAGDGAKVRLGRSVPDRGGRAATGRCARSGAGLSSVWDRTAGAIAPVSPATVGAGGACAGTGVGAVPAGNRLSGMDIGSAATLGVQAVGDVARSTGLSAGTDG